jgi:tripartite-type tricarboxylate transporter receptor subunit TctC
MSQAFGQPVVVDNRPGAGGNIGADIVAKSAPDGYTLVMGTIGTHAINSALYKHMPYDGIKDFAPVAFVADAETVLVVNPAIPATSVASLIALAKAKPGELTFASGGAGTTGHLAGELFEGVTGTKMVHVPYKGNAPAMTDLVAGQVSMSFATLQTALPFIKSGKLVALATLGTARSAALPNVPTLEESGLRGFEVRNWTGMLAPAGTPDAIVKKLAAEVNAIMGSPEIQARLRSDGLAYTQMGPESFAAFVRSETDKWTKIVKAAGVQMD